MASFARLAGRAVAGAGVLALSPVLGLATLAGMAMVGAEPTTFVVTGLAVFGSVFFLGLLLCVPRPRAAWGRWLRAAVILGVETTVVWQVSVATLRPAPYHAPLAPVAGQREWRLPTGSELAYVRLAPKRVTRPDPVVFLHGGPGVADLAASSAFLGKLTADGYQVYVYDQLGAGRSARLRDPRGYGLTRDVEDLEAIRQAVGAKRLNLIAQDYGAQLAAAYLAAHPDRVARAVLSSPAGLSQGSPAAPVLASPSEPSQGAPAWESQGREADGKVEVAAVFGRDGTPDPRLLAVSTLLRVDARAAHAFAGDRELGAYLDLVRQGAPHPCPAAATGSGGYVALTGRTAPGSLRLRLSGVTAPVLIVKGGCDEQSWASAMSFRRALPSATLAYLGGSTYRSEAYLGLLRAFLSGRPVPAYEGQDPPPGYRGPAGAS
ncbi:alpha/beta fold hydrolase [Nonomuraea turkmeniaca]|uniref:Alpha/beta fold hydrolase n=1 Tax=Nonomuraea turkmeniaca TaxID=103838 RepID=A0A5S4FKP0_9ACTN|nr:alpha/beta hydrolase [Nonomuraea turkmeniaca]TMR20801.1 alpha/beta fold hydrolase [Nonomuraea turkmeniaca]